MRRHGSKLAILIALACGAASCGYPEDDADFREDCRPGTAVGTKEGSILGIIDLGTRRACVVCKPGTYCPGGGERAVPCARDTWDDDGDPRTECAAKTSCVPGTRVVDDGDAARDRACDACVPGTYTDGYDRRQCLPAVRQPCKLGYASPPPRTDRAPYCFECAAGTYCPGGFDAPIPCAPGTWDDDGSGATACVPWSECLPGQYVGSTDGTTTADRPCHPCGDDAYSTVPMATACTPRTTCPPGTYAFAPDAHRDRSCIACPAGSVSTTFDAPTCGAVRSIGSGADQSCEVMTDGTVRCWGAAVAKNQEPRPRSTPEEIPGIGAGSSVAAGGFHACARDALGVRCWGSDEHGQLGSGKPGPPSATAVPLWLAPTLRLVATSSETFALGRDGSVAGWGGLSDPLALGGHGLVQPALVRQLRGAFDLAAFDGIACVTTLGISIRCIGRDRVVATTPLPGVVDVVLGRGHACARDRAGVVSCFQRVDSGSIGDGPTPAIIPGLTAVTALASGMDHVCAIQGGEVFCFGKNESGQLGDGTTLERTVPTLVPSLTDVVAITAGYRHTCALVANGAVFCWGGNDRGQLGTGDFLSRTSPSPVRTRTSGATPW